MSEDFDPDWGLPPRPMRPLPQVAKLTAERDELHAKLVKAVIEIVGYWPNVIKHSIDERIAMARNVYGIRLRWTGDGFEEDKG